MSRLNFGGSKFMFKTLLSLLTGKPDSIGAFSLPKSRPVRKLTERELLRRESAIGAQLFGPLPKGREREFFCLDDATWIWHETWKDEKGRPQQATTRYEVHSGGILKVQAGARYEYINGAELNNLTAATRLYYERVAREVYHRDPQTGAKLA